MNFGMIRLNQSAKTKQNYPTWILTALLFIFLLKIFLKTLTIMLKDGLIHLTMIRMTKDNFQWYKKVIGLFKDKLEGKIMKEFCAFRAKKCPYLMDDDNEKKKANGLKKCVIKRRL